MTPIMPTSVGVRQDAEQGGVDEVLTDSMSLVTLVIRSPVASSIPPTTADE
jgi:hypothetical protein